ncbi:MAG: VOC family protein [Anaerolineae bacterium]|nr:VOC family protein [Anaerolineae bacterium]
MAIQQAAAQKITPWLWFDGQAEAAAEFYVSIFNNARILNVSRYSEAGPGEPGSVLTVTFELEGQSFGALNGGPVFQFTPAISFQVDCKTQEEVDHLWDRLLEGGEADQCGWLRDKFGVSWQIVPGVLGELMSDPDPVKAQRVTEAMLQMVKLDIKALQAAYAGQ